MVAVLLLAGCGAGRLQTADRPLDGQGRVCLLALLEGVLLGDPSDPRIAWLRNGAGGRTEVIWPWGFAARFTPELEIVARDGTVVGRHGRGIRLGGSSGEDGFRVCEVDGRIWSGPEMVPPPRS